MSKRRTFMKSVAAASAAAGSMTLGSASVQAAKKIDPRKPFRRTSRYKNELVPIGLVVGSRFGGHVGIWAPTWNPVENNMRTTKRENR